MPFYVRLFLYRHLMENKRLAPYLYDFLLSRSYFITSLRFSLTPLLPKKNRPQWTIDPK